MFTIDLFKAGKARLTSSLRNMVLAVIILIFLSLSFQSNAQGWIRGYVKDSLTYQPIIGAHVKSFSTGTNTDSAGSFIIRVNEGDRILVNAANYNPQNVNVSFHNMDSIQVIYLKPLGQMLQNITIFSKYSVYQLDSANRKKKFEAQISKITAVSKLKHEGFGIILNIDHITKNKDKQIARQRRLFEKTEEEAYINYRFTSTLVAFYTGLKNDSLQTFMRMVRPSYYWLREHPKQEELVWYINDKLKDYLKR